MHLLILIFLYLSILLIDTPKITPKVSVDIRLAINTGSFIDLLRKRSILRPQKISIPLNSAILIEFITYYYRGIIDKHPQNFLYFFPHLRTCGSKNQKEVHLYLIKLDYLHRVITRIIGILTFLRVMRP